MKRLNYNAVESTPFINFHIKSTPKDKGGWFKLYWSNRAGVYGHQVHYEGNDYNKCQDDDSNAGGYFCGKTNGCGYSKEAQAINDCLFAILGKAPQYHAEASYLFRELKKGGNYYEGTRAQILRILKETK